MPLSYNPVADGACCVVFGKARFTVLTSQMIRMEWSEDHAFEDRATLAVVNRNLPAVPFEHKALDNKLTLKTNHLALEYLDDGKPFCRRNLQVTFTLAGRKITWQPGRADSRNLKGTARTLDGIAGAIELGPGLLSRNGWALIDDSENLLLDRSQGAQGFDAWVAPRPRGLRQDLYLLAYGLEYKKALRDAMLILGRQPLPPRYTLGYWWSRYWAYTDRELERLVEQFDRVALPLDVFVIDMDWHLPGWTGYTWEKRYFPDPKEFLQWLEDQDLKITLNLHPAEGVHSFEESFEAMCQALGRDPKKTKTVEFDCTDPKYMAAYFRLLHHPQEANHVDFWWLDWQQGNVSRIAGLDPLAWLNHLHWRDQERPERSERPLIFSRFGGLGSNRYPIGFSGDTVSLWESLAFQPYFTATASNVLFGYWSHDIGGHEFGPVSPELYTRWMQYGIHSPIVRTHTTKNPQAERRIWAYPEPYSNIMMHALRRRYEMVPYIYTENRRCFDTGVSLCRPMYYDHPEQDNAYRADGQYMFGDRMLVSPVVEPVSSEDSMARQEVWLPQGQWFDTALGRLEKGGRWIRHRYDIHETPVFVPAGAVIPGQPWQRRLLPGSYRQLVVSAYVGGNGSYELYEDDGLSKDYLLGRCAWIPLVSEQSPTTWQVRVEPPRGTYNGFQDRRSLDLYLVGTAPPLSVRVEGTEVPYAFRPRNEPCWHFDGYNAAVLVRVPDFDITRGVTIEATLEANGPEAFRRGYKGMMHRLERIFHRSNWASSYKTFANERLPADVVQTGNRIMRDPRRCRSELENLRKLLRQLPACLREYRTQRLDETKMQNVRLATAIMESMLRDFADVL